MSALMWQVPGDLDPALSPHHLTTHKAAYLKLRFLVDSGAIFVGHGLKKDFRMLNIVVPPAQARRSHTERPYGFSAWTSKGPTAPGACIPHHHFRLCSAKHC